MFALRGTPGPILKKLCETAPRAVRDADSEPAMATLETPIAYLDAPEFQKSWDGDAGMPADAIMRMGRIEEKR